MADIEHYTVVYQVHGDNDLHHKWWADIRPLFLAEAGPVRITSVAKEDHATKLNLIQEVVERGDMDPFEQIEMVRDLLDSSDIDKWRRENMPEKADV